MNRHLIRYHKIVNHYKSAERNGCTLYEKHHITPKCLGGTNDLENIVTIPARAHIICHYLLHLAYPENRALAAAFAMMSVNNKFQNRRVSSRLYEAGRLARKHALIGVPRPEWVKAKLRKPKADTNKYFGNTNAHGLKGKTFKKPRTEEHTSNQVASRKWYDEKRMDETSKKKKAIRRHFVVASVSRKEFYLLYPEIGESTIKRYLAGL